MPYGAFRIMFAYVKKLSQKGHFDVFYFSAIQNTIAQLMKRKLLVIFIASGMGVASCSEKNSSDKEKNILSQSNDTMQVKINRDALNEMIQSLPQPIEIADIISKSDMAFSKGMLIPADLSEKFSDKYFQAMAFGAYGVDLGYININEKSIYSLEYLESIKNLAEELKVSQFFDFSTLAELSKNRENMDSLIQISTRNFNKIDEFLRDEDRGELSVLILIGAWMEGMHMFGEIEKTSPSADMKQRIGEQKIIFDNVMALLEKLSSIDHFKKLTADFAELKNAYDKVTISYIYKTPVSKEVNGELVIEDNSETKVEITDETVTQVINAVEKIRTKYLLPQ
jgi:hypothetical protein